jgi:hypothetical protein
VSDIEFRDKDPEDAWDDGDDASFKIKILERLVDSIRLEKRDGGAARAERRRKDGLRLLLKVERTRHADASRIEDIREALEKL